MSDIVERLRADAETSQDCASNWEAFDCSEAMRKAADEIARLREQNERMLENYFRLAYHIAPNESEEFILSHAPEQVIDVGLQVRQAALSTAHAEGMEEAARYHDDCAAEHEACGWESQHHEMMAREHRRFAAAIRRAKESKT